MKYKDLDVSLTKEEIDLIKKEVKREPTTLEVGMMDVMWSEHCSYKSSKNYLKLLPTKGKNVIMGPGEDGGIVKFDDENVLVLSFESHNHPSAIEPFGGAATGVGGIYRDIFCMGARPIAGLDSLRFGELSNERVRYLFENVVRGISEYGNCVGIPTVAGDVKFGSKYEKNCLVNAMCVGYAKRKDIIRSVASNPGDYFIIAGGTTGRDGIHGVTFASEELNEDSEEERGAVQIGDPFTEKQVMEAALEANEKGYLNGMKDLGGGGLTCASSEMAAAGNCGAEIDINLVPQREPNMTSYEIMISESQERMLFAVDEDHKDDLCNLLKWYNISYAIIGRVTDTGQFIVKDKDKILANIPAKFISGGITYNRTYKKPKDFEDQKKIEKPKIQDIEKSFLKLIESPNIASKKWVYEQYDHEVQIKNVIKCGSDSAVLRIKNKKGIALKTDCNGFYCDLDPYTGAAGAVAECLRNISCVGAESLCCVDCLNVGNPEKEESFWRFKEVINGIKDACEEFNIPIVGGNVSFYNEAEGISIYPTPLIGILGKIEDVNKVKNSYFKSEGNYIVCIGATKDEMGGSEYYRLIYNIDEGEPPKVDFKEEYKNAKFVSKCINHTLLNAAHDCSEGGLAITIAEMTFLNELGSKIDISKLNKTNLEDDEILFSESHARYILEIPKEKIDEFKKQAKKMDIIYSIIGKTQRDRFIIINKNKELINIEIKEIKNRYESAIPKIMGV